MYEDSFWQNKKVLVTGHTGFKGSWLVLWLLKKGAKVWGYSLETDNEKCLFNQIGFLENNKNNILNTSFYHEIGDINDFDNLKSFILKVSPDIVFHLAAKALVLESFIDPLNTWNTNVLGSLKLLESLKLLKNKCSVVMVTSDKVYENNGISEGFTEKDRLGGNDPYSSSKAAMEIAIKGWKSSFIGEKNLQINNLAIASARAGNVIGGGDWAENRIVPDIINAFTNNKPILIRNKNSVRPWQHVLEPLKGYMLLAKKMFYCLNENPDEIYNYTKSFNFGPNIDDQKTVKDLVNVFLTHWPNQTWIDDSDPNAPNESKFLYLVSDFSKKELNWLPKWNFEKTVSVTSGWYENFQNGKLAIDCCLKDIYDYESQEN